MRRSLVVILFISISWVGYSQVNQKTVKEFGVGLSMLTGYTDIGGAEGASAQSITEFSQMSKRVGVVGYYKYNINPRYSIKLNGTVGLLAGTDKGSRNEGRGYSFSSFILDVSVIGVYYIVAEKEPFFFKSSLRRQGWSRNVYPSLYIQAGIGACIYTPSPNDKLKNATLVGYEGGKTATPVFPVGLGSTLPISRDVRFFLETNYVFTLTDYLDGYNNPLYSKSKDSYMTITAGLVYQIGNEKTNWRKSRLYRR
ncbi:DUF6089 family protein [uncultured Acetobacteroides sp.]|uniref:DUF6089 family protein n=1 Tax=uncultured Acetobacteroides sp. TaxID=1760811 RepID=UPI0029F49B02|nr:DUF6089 family protein [uncultured Acetobacteroides sp.]